MISFLFRFFDTAFRIFCSFVNAVFTVASKLLNIIFWPISHLLNWQLDHLSGWWTLFCAGWIILLLLALALLAICALSRWKREQ